MKKQARYIILALLMLIIITSVSCQSKKGDNQGQADKQGKMASENIKSFPSKLENPNLLILATEQSRVDEEFTQPIAEFEKKYGGKVNIVLVPPGEAEKKLIAGITSGASYDLVRWIRAQMPRYAIKGLLQPINDLVDVDDPVWEYGIKANDGGWYNGKLYGMCAEPQVGLLYFNQTIFENNGMKTPLQLYNEGKWNWEVMREAAAKLTQYDPGGAVLLKGLALAAADVANFLITSNQSDMVTISPSGEITLNIFDPNVIEALQLYQDMTYKDKSLSTMGMGPSSAEFVAGKLAMYISWDEQSKGDTFADFKGEWGVVPVPVGPNGKSDVLAGGGASYGIPMGAPNPEGGAVMMWLRQKHSNEDVEARLLRINYSPEYAKLLMKWRGQSLISSNALGIGNWGKINNNLLTDLRKGTPVITVLEKVAPQYQAEIDSMNK